LLPSIYFEGLLNPSVLQQGAMLTPFLQGIAQQTANKAEQSDPLSQAL